MSLRDRTDRAMQSQRRENLQTFRKQKASHIESSEWEAKAQRDFDKWFFAKPKDEQAVMRERGIKPYCEHGDPRQGLAPLYEKSNYFGFTEGDKNHTESDTFISRDKVADIVNRILSTLSTSTSPEVRLHVELIKISLQTIDALNGEELGKLYGLTRAGVNYRVQRIRDTLYGKKVKKAPSKESPTGGVSQRVAAHRRKKTETSCKKPKIARK